MKRTITGICAALFLAALLGATVQAKTVTAASCSQTNVQAATDSATSGDTVVVPGGSCTWSAGVSISSSQQITLNGGGNTSITFASGGGFNITAGTTASTQVTGFTFNQAFTNGGCPIFVTTSTSPLSQPFRFFNNKFNGGSTSAPGTILCVYQNGPGLIDHNTFSFSHGADEMIHVLGNGASNTSGWSDTVTPGGPNMIFIEDNTFTETGSLASALQSYYGARTVVRHNTLNNAQLDQHGSGGIGARWWEFYNNTFNSAIMCLRAGSGVIFSNTGAGVIIMVQEGSSPYAAPYQVGRGQNQVLNPAYAWNNGGASLSLNTTGCAPPEAGMVQLNRDVYQPSSGTALPGSCTTNDAYWRTDQNTLYKCTSSNTWTTYYKPYTYPHPRTQGSSTASLLPPTNLSATAQ